MYDPALPGQESKKEQELFLVMEQQHSGAEFLLTATALQTLA